MARMFQQESRHAALPHVFVVRKILPAVFATSMLVSIILGGWFAPLPIV